MAKLATSHRVGFNPSAVNSILRGVDEKTEYSMVDQVGLFEGDQLYIRIGTGASDINDSIFRRMMTGERLADICHINLGCHCVLSKITNKHIEEYGDEYVLNEGVYVLNLQEAQKFENADDKEKAKIKPFIKNSNIGKWTMTFADLKFIYLRWEDNLDDFPIIKEHLLRFKKIRLSQVESYGEKTWPWYAIHRPREEFLFAIGDKIVLPYRSKRNIFAYTNKEVFASGDVFFILLNKKGQECTNIKYILGLLNSELYYFWLYHKGKRKGDILEMYWQPLAEVPVIIPSAEEQKKVIDLSEHMISLSESGLDCSDDEERLNAIVHEIYGLSEAEIKAVKETYCGYV